MKRGFLFCHYYKKDESFWEIWVSCREIERPTGGEVTGDSKEGGHWIWGRKPT